MFYSQDVLEEVRLGNDIVDVISKYTNLKQKGSSFFGLCPFHKENSPSFSVSPDKQLYHCFGCGASGNVYSFIMKIENYDFIDSVKFLADRINYILPEPQYSAEAKKANELRTSLFEIHKKAARHYYSILNSKEGLAANEYLNNREINEAVRKKYGLGFSSYKKDNLFRYLLNEGYDIDAILKSGLVLKGKQGYYDRFYGRIMFPIIDVQGKIVGFGGRIINNEKKEAKYLNSPETSIFSKSHNLYSLNFARQSKTKEFILVEGYMDVISLYQSGFHNVVASLGTAFNDDHSKVLKKYADSVIILFDSDEAGTNAALKAIPVLVRNGLHVRVQQVNDAKDPDEFIKKFGVNEFKGLVDNSKSYVSFQVECIKKNYNLNNSDQKIAFTKEVAQIISKIDNAIEQDVYIKEISNFTGISESAIKTEVNNKDIGYLNLESKKYNKPKYKVDSVGINEARKSILSIMCSSKFFYNCVSKYIQPEEFCEYIYIKLAKIIKDTYEKNAYIYPAEIVNHFETIDEQQVISEIFIPKFDYEDKVLLKKAINDQLKKVKLAYIDKMMLEGKDINEIQKFFNARKNIDKLYITLSDG